MVVIWPGIAQYAGGEPISMHWSRAVLASLLAILFVALGTTTFTLNMLELIQAQRGPGGRSAPPDRVRPARAHVA